MGWARKEEVSTWDPATYKEERLWVSAYPDSQDRWIADFKPHYDLVGVYDIDTKTTLYRFQIDESRMAELHPSCSKFSNVVILHAEAKPE